MGKLFIFCVTEMNGQSEKSPLSHPLLLKNDKPDFDMLPAFVIHGKVLFSWYLVCICVFACTRMEFSFQHGMDCRRELGRLLYLFQPHIYASMN